MKSTSIIVLLALIGYSSQVTRHPVRQELVEEIKLKAESWTPVETHQNLLRDVHPDKIKSRLGNLGFQEGSLISKLMSYLPFKTKFLGNHNHEHNAKSSHKKLQSPMLQDIFPQSFDFREQHPTCLREIRDQLDCGACWAFSSSGMLADRICKATDGKVNLEFSPQDMVACSMDNYGCQGGYLMNSIDFLMNDGVVIDKCQPYRNALNKCEYSCTDKTIPYKKHYCRPGSLKIMTTAEEFKQELLTNGPFIVSLTVYEDFINYGNGTYTYIAGEIIGGHAMKMMGWSTENGKTVWLLQNQWSDQWGEKGFIKILEGEIGIDSIGISCQPELNSEESK
ncbi:cathepsin b [Stylonychia lemnae]|uniref:Cathepsin b n=1 Tax=Stylonychia lemnae TaxID=5949 RepID=A0A078A5J2_STYLE|nr:cathepsin b [Stylonychia lemnae]|eukprot:CDW76850.1 cathepsin b [Stylonychia lemnae]